MMRSNKSFSSILAHDQNAISNDSGCAGSITGTSNALLRSGNRPFLKNPAAAAQFFFANEGIIPSTFDGLFILNPNNKLSKVIDPKLAMPAIALSQNSFALGKNKNSNKKGNVPNKPKNM